MSITFAGVDINVSRNNLVEKLRESIQVHLSRSGNEHNRELKKKGKAFYTKTVYIEKKTTTENSKNHQTTVSKDIE